MSKFENAPEVQEVANKLIGQFHSHLVEAKIRYLFRTGDWVSKGMPVYGQAQKCSDKDKFLTGYDFIITIAKEYWDEMSPDEKKANVDHQLLHCGRGASDYQGNPTWVKNEHDFEGFVTEVKRHGFWTEELKRFDIQYRQLTMFETKQRPA